MRLKKTLNKSSSKIIKDIRPDFKPTVSIILGSGLGDFTEQIKNKNEILYKDLPGFPETSVQGHSGKLVFGSIGHTQVLVFQGRSHYYERGDCNGMRGPIETIKSLGCNRLIITNSSGAINPEYKPGEVILIRDHINYSGISPLLGKNGPSMFIDMTKVYDLRFVNTICYPTKRNQEQIKDLAEIVDIMIIIGSFTSANSKRLASLSLKINRNTYQVTDANELNEKWFDNFNTVGISAGASTPDYLIDEISKKIENIGNEK